MQEGVTDDKLRELFGEHGNITSVRVMRDERQKSKGFGFVCFSTTEEAHSAVQAKSSGFSIDGKPVYVGFAQTKAVRQQQVCSLARLCVYT